MSTTIRVRCTDQALTYENTPVIASGGLEVNSVHFEFCAKWDGFVRTAVFWRSPAEVYHVLLDDTDTCKIPREVLQQDGLLHFGVFGVHADGRQRPAEALTYRVVKGAITEGTKPTDPTPDIYTKLLAEYTEMQAALAQAVEDVTAAGEAATAAQKAAASSATTAAKRAEDAASSAVKAASSASAAATSASNAASSKSGAETASKVALAASEAAGESEINAKASENAASSSASAAATSASNAASSKSGAETASKVALAASEAAGESEINAKASENAAASSKSGAETASRVAIAASEAAGESEINAKASENAAAEYAEQAKKAADGGAGSWDDLGNGVGMGTLLAETTLTSVTTNLAEELGLIVGNTYTVTWNGVDYTPTATDASDLSGVEGAILLGMSGGYPFTILVKPGNGTLITIDSGSAPVTVSVAGVGHIIIPIPGKFLPKGTPWIEESETVEILPNYTITEENMDADIAGIPRLGLVAGNTYIVKLQGTEYTCVAWEAAQDGITAVGLGDIYTASEGAAGSAPTGEPFVLMEYPPEFAAQVGFNVQVIPLVEMAFPVVFSITGGGATVHKLDNRCLDLAWLPTMIEGSAEVLSPRTIAVGLTSFTDFNTVENPAGLPFVVRFNEKQYKCVMQKIVEGDGVAYLLGNAAVVTGDYDGTGEPFAFLRYPAQDVYVWYAYFETSEFTEDGCNIAVYGNGYNKMPDGFLPENIFKNEDESLVLTSAENADGLRKKYKITVSYDGTLSATEV